MASPLTIPVRDVTRTHIVDELIEERAERLRQRPRLWAFVRAVVNPMLGYGKAVRLANQLAPMEGRMTVNVMSAALRLEVETNHEPDLPQTGPAVIVANHPGGIADGVAVWDALVERRPDLMFFANRDALRVCPGLDEIVIPVEWREDSRSREKNRQTVRAAADAFRDGRAVVVFPAGRIAQWSWRELGLVEREWAATPVTMARKFGAPILPVGVGSRMSLLYYALAQVSDELRNITLFHELLRARGWRYHLRYGPLIQPGDLPSDPIAATARLRLMCQALSSPF